MTTMALIEKTFDLKLIAAHLEGLEETIISKLIDRAQFSLNDAVYQKGKSGFNNADDQSLFDLRLRYMEEIDAKFGRFTSPEERPFGRELPAMQRTGQAAVTGLAISDFDAINMTAEVLPVYHQLVPQICEAGDDGQYGSAVEHDVFALQAIARRIHFGALYVSESKYRSNPKAYDELVAQNDMDGLMALLTRADVEARILDRVAGKVAHLQKEINPNVRRKISPDVVLEFYKTHLIPLTKEGEIKYFLNRK